jgi:uncharacterized protein YgbK (DUF1537 family)
MANRLGIVADDNTGASDAAGMLTERGIRTALVLDADPAPDVLEALGRFDAVVVGTQNRSVAPEEAAAATVRAIAMLQALQVARFQGKSCSTFDSTREGHIGPTLDAAMDALAGEATIVCPALPVNGRTVYMGHLFVGEELLSDSPLSRHPLNPMTDANLVRWLGYQTRRKVALVPLAVVRRGAEAVRSALDELARQGCAYMVTDAVDDTDLLTLARATQDWPLLSGGSGITSALARIHWPDCGPLDFGDRLAELSRPTLVVSGSQSPMTRRQNEHALRSGFACVVLDVAAVLRGEFDEAHVAEEAAAGLADVGALLVHSMAGPEDGVRRSQDLGASLGLTEVQTGERIADALAGLTARLVGAGDVGRLIVSGGETSGAVCRRLGTEVLEVGLPLAPGVPFCFPFPGPGPLTVLKSGNFGAEDLYAQVRRLGGPA